MQCFHFNLWTFLSDFFQFLKICLQFSDFCLQSFKNSSASHIFQYTFENLHIRCCISVLKPSIWSPCSNFSIISAFLHYVSDLFPACPSGWVFGGYLGCYYVAKEVSTMNQTSAQNICKWLDITAHLAEIRTKEIQDFIQDFVLSLDYLQSHNYWWLGGNDKAQVWNIY